MFIINPNRIDLTSSNQATGSINQIAPGKVKSGKKNVSKSKDWGLSLVSITMVALLCMSFSPMLSLFLLGLICIYVNFQLK